MPQLRCYNCIMFNNNERAFQFGVKTPTREKAGYRSRPPLQFLLAFTREKVVVKAEPIEIKPPKGDPESYDRLH